MKRGDIYRIYRPEDDPKRHRICIVISRQEVIDSGFSTVICAPVYSNGQGISKPKLRWVRMRGIKHDSWILCDNLGVLPESSISLNSWVRSPPTKLAELDEALRIALALD